MITIPANFMGDHWVNPEELQDILARLNPSHPVQLDLRSEGPSLWRLGLVQMILQHCERTGRDPASIGIARWSNPVESVPFTRYQHARASHFYWQSLRYYPYEPIACEQGDLWGFFMGRPTMPRMSLLRYLSQQPAALLSCMRGAWLPDWKRGRHIDLEEFGPDQDLCTWYLNCGIPSLDGACIQDQWRDDLNVNASLLAHYASFHIEIVAESYCHGDTFFPTEKTIRPLAAGKPIVVMGPRYFLHRLKAKGFRTWGDLWDESYDRLEGAPRLWAIKQVIQDVQQRSAELLPLLERHARHNRAVLSYMAGKHRPMT